MVPSGDQVGTEGGKVPKSLVFCLTFGHLQPQTLIMQVRIYGPKCGQCAGVKTMKKNIESSTVFAKRAKVGAGSLHHDITNKNTSFCLLFQKQNDNNNVRGEQMNTHSTKIT